MDSIYIILYAVIVAVLVTIFFPRLGKLKPRLLLGLSLAGLLVLLVIIFFAFTR